MLRALFSLRRAALSLVFVSGLAGAISETAPALASGPTIVDNGSMAPWIVKVAGAAFTPNNFAAVEIVDVATGFLWEIYPLVPTSKQLCLYAINSPGVFSCWGGGTFSTSYSPNLNCAPAGRNVSAWDFGSKQWSNKIHLAC